MEEKDVNDIASAVSNALAKLNGDKENKPEKNSEEETFKCPECGASVKGGILFCQSCGCALEWEM